MKTRKIMITVFALLLFSITANAQSIDAKNWTAPAVVGSGSDPIFSADSNNQISVIFEGEDRVMHSRFQADGTWSKPEDLTTAVSENTFQTYDEKGNKWIAQDQDNELIVFKAATDSLMLEKETVVEKNENLSILHFSIDQRGIAHLLYGQTPAYDCEANNPGMDMFYRRRAGKQWEKPLLIASKVSFSRKWQKPGISVNTQGQVYICSYRDLYTINAANEVSKEVCPINDLSMPVAITTQGSDTLHLAYHASVEGAGKVDENLYYVMRQNGNWSKPSIIGKQPAEHSPAIFLTPDQELHVAWQDLDGNIVVSRKKEQ